jgi:hypothetical protein
MRTVADGPVNGRRPRGRPRALAVSPTVLGRWMDAQGMSVREFVGRFNERAVEMALAGELDEVILVRKTTVYDLRNGQYMPRPQVMKVIRAISGGAVDYDAW